MSAGVRAGAGAGVGVGVRVRVGVLVVGALVGCSRGAVVGTDAQSTAVLPVRSDTPVADAGGPTEPGPARVKLLDPGQAPRTRLRYAWRVGQRERLAMDLRTAASTESGGQLSPEIALPAVSIDVAIDPESVSPDGDLRYAWHVTGTHVGGDAPGSVPLAEGMRAEVGAVERLAGQASVNALGLTTAFGVDEASLPEAGAGGSGQMIEQVRQTLRDLAAPFPDEPIGRGARWEKLSQLSSREARLTQTDTFTLLELARTGGRLDDVLAQTAPSQPLPTPGSPGAQARMDSMLASGDAKTTFDWTRLVPQTTFEGTTTMVVSSRAPPDGVERRTMILHVAIVLKGSVVPVPAGGDR